METIFSFLLEAVSFLFSSGLILGVGMATGLTGKYLSGVDAWTPDREQKWSQIYHIEHERYRIFNETYTGTTWSRRGPEKVQGVTGAPIKTDSSLVSSGYIKHTEMDRPLFDNSQGRLNAGRLRGQKRTDSENIGSKLFLATPLGLFFDSVREDDVEIGQQEIATGQLTRRLVDKLQRHMGNWKDDETLISLLSGYPQFMYRTIASVRGVSDESVPIADVEMGVKRPPTEHPNQFVYTIQDSVPTVEEPEFTSDNSVWGERITTELNKIDSDATPGLKLLNRIVTYVQKKKMQGVEFVGDGQKYSMFIIIVSPLFMERLNEDEDFARRYHYGYMGAGFDHPLIRPGDIRYQNLLIRSEEKLLEDQFKAKYHFNAEGHDPGYGGEATDAKINVTGTPGEATHEVELEWGERTLETGNIDRVERFYILGADSCVYVPGNPYPIGPRDTDDYGRITAFGAKHIMGYHRTDWEDAAKNIVLNQSSAVGYCYA